MNIFFIQIKSLKTRYKLSIIFAKLRRLKFKDSFIQDQALLIYL